MAFSRPDGNGDGGGADGNGASGLRPLVYFCPRCRARNVGFGDVPPTCAACGLPLGPEDVAAPPDTRGRTSWGLSLAVVLALGFIVWQQHDQLGDPGFGLGAWLGLGGHSTEEMARGRSEAIHLCAAEARSRLGSAFDDTPFTDEDVRAQTDGGFRISSHAADADSLPGLIHAGFACRVRRVGGTYGGWEIGEFTVRGGDTVPPPASAPPPVNAAIPTPRHRSRR